MVYGSPLNRDFIILIMARLRKPEKFGYVSMKRDYYSTKNGKVIRWWKKGCIGSYFYKCDAIYKGQECVGIGNTVKEAIDECVSWMEYFDKEVRLCQ